MSPPIEAGSAADPAAHRAAVLYRQHQQEICLRADRLFASLLLCEWLVALVLAVGVAPLAWADKSAPPESFLPLAVFLGGAIIGLPCLLALTRPGRPITRQAVGVAQMLMGLLLLHLTAGRPETRYYTFASLALLAFYRDWRVLVTAMIVEMAGTLIVGTWWPESIYGTTAVTPLRWLEHTGWVLAENLFLIASCGQTVTEMRDTALRQAQLEISNATVEEKVRARTRELHVSQALKAAILESALDAILTVDAQGRVTQLNPAAERMFGRTRAEALAGLRGEDLLPALRLPPPGQAGGPPLGRRFEAAGRRQDGGEFSVEMIVVLLHLEGEARYTAYVHDITERKRSDAELVKAKDAAEAASRAKSEFLANVSHEVRTPLNGILGMTELALQTDLDAEQRDYLGLVRSSAGALLTVINDLLDYAKIEAGKMHLDPVDFDVRELIDEALRPLALRARAKGLGLTYQVRPDVPALLVGDAVRLRQVLVNLVGNAVKFTEAGEVIVQVEATAFAHHEVGLHVSVRDTGIGIPADKHALIFSPFAQADGSTTRRFGGTGLGLSICARLVDLMGGHIWLESEPDQGSTFHFTARLARSFTAPPALRAFPERTGHRANGTPAADALPPLRVLLAEDNAVNQKFLIRLLQRAGHTVTVAETGRQALDALRAQEFDLVLMDVQMPEMDGLEATRALRAAEREAGRHVPVIALTAHAARGDRDRCLEAGMDGYLPKPVDPQAFWETVRGLLLGPSEPAGVSAEEESPVLDREAILRRLEGDEGLLKELVDLFRGDSVTLLEQVGTALGDGDAEAARRAAHTLKSSLGLFEAHGAARATRRLEEAARSGDLALAEEALKDLQGEIERLRPALAALVPETACP
jgi:PAS domain S-box-containing protein